MAQLVCATMERRTTMVSPRFRERFILSLAFVRVVVTDSAYLLLVHVCIAPRIRNEIYIRLDQPILSLTYRPICLRKRAMEESFQRLHRVCLLLHRGIRYHCDALESSRQLRATVTGNGRSSIFPISHLDFSNYGSLSFLHIYIYMYENFTYESLFICFLLRASFLPFHSFLSVSWFICRSKWLVSSSKMVDKKRNLQIMGS